MNQSYYRKQLRIRKTIELPFPKKYDEYDFVSANANKTLNK